VISFDTFDAYVRAREREYIEELKSLVRLPTVSAQKSAIDETALAVLERTRRAGVVAESLRVAGGPPTIVGETGRGKKTLLVYDHYDVQPPDPLDEWNTPPFEPTERDGHLFARGVSDNKGNLMARLQAIEAYRATMGELPLRVRVLYEGEEEIGSEHLAEFIDRHADRLRADGCIWEAGYKDAAGRPTVSLGLKGIAYFELRVRGAKQDAHSSVATIIPNAAWRLVWALATLKNERDEIVIDGFMEAVRKPTPDEIRVLEALPYDEEATKRIHDVPRFIRGLTGTPLKLKHFFEPTCTICGLTSGYSGPGSKTVLPRSRARSSTSALCRISRRSSSNACCARTSSGAASVTSRSSRCTANVRRVGLRIQRPRARPLRRAAPRMGRTRSSIRSWSAADRWRRSATGSGSRSSDSGRARRPPPTTPPTRTSPSPITWITSAPSVGSCTPSQAIRWIDRPREAFLRFVPRGAHRPRNGRCLTQSLPTCYRLSAWGQACGTHPARHLGRY
jgi:acetylornithine deacetylase/succinyl-diaminopimelate desuccinylase-like protein